MPGVYPRYSKKTGKLIHYVIWWRDERGKRQKEKGPREKSVAERIAREYQSKADLRRAGLVDPKEEAFAEHLGKPIDEHKEAFLANRPQQTGKHIHETRQRIELIIERAGMTTLLDLSFDNVQDVLNRLLEDGKAPSTVNRYRAAIRAFSRWCWASDRLRHDPLKMVEGLNEEVDQRRVRRTISREDLDKLIRATAAGPKYRRIDGPTRALVYRLASVTGLRSKELRDLGRERLRLGDKPEIYLEAGQTKNRRAAWQPIPADIAAALRLYLEGHTKKQLFPLPEKGARMLRGDLERAGIPYRDEKGEYFDFHSLRCEFATLMDEAGVPMGVRQKLMRHSTPELTARYTRHRDDTLARAVESIGVGATCPAGASPKGAEAAEEGKTPRPPPGRVITLNQRVEGSSPSGSTEQDQGNQPVHRESPFTMNGVHDGRAVTICNAAERNRVRAGAPPDPDLSRLIESWPAIPDRIRSAIMALVEIANPKPPDG